MYIKEKCIVNQFQMVSDCLKKNGISYQIVEHKPALSTEEADSYIKGIDGVRTKTMFLTNKKKTAYYLLVMDDKKRLDMKKLKDILHENRIKLASEQSLMLKMGVVSGVVSIFGLLNNKDKDIQVLFDNEIINEPRMCFHPNVNDKTIFLNTNDVFKFIKAIGFNYNIVNI